jgi:Holliday junction resolvasome RuvABC DNA-binding subunit
MAETKTIEGNGERLLQALTILNKYVGSRSALDVYQTPSDKVVVYLNAMSVKSQPKVKPEDITALEDLGYSEREDEDGYTIFLDVQV